MVEAQNWHGQQLKFLNHKTTKPASRVLGLVATAGLVGTRVPIVAAMARIASPNILANAETVV